MWDEHWWAGHGLSEHWMIDDEYSNGGHWTGE
jgi:hypothetical protein